MKPVVLSAESVSVTFPVGSGTRAASGRNTRKKELHAVDSVSFKLHEGEILGVVGESGSGKSTLIRACLDIVPLSSGRIRYRNIDISRLTEFEKKEIRKKMQIVFQNPHTSLNPRITIGKSVREALDELTSLGQMQKTARVYRALEQTGLRETIYHSRPGTLSGGQKQRAAIARSLTIAPEILFADEPVSSLDVSSQAAVLNLLKDLCSEYGFAMVFVSHDMSVIRYICDRVVVMFNGRIVEENYTEELFRTPRCEYTADLLNSIFQVRYRSRLRNNT
jgi:peptide/nickel transport system ATP-binding protein